MDFSLTTLFVVPVGNTLPTSGSTQNLTAGQFGIFKNDYTAATSGTIAAAPYFYFAQGRTNTYLQSTKRSDKISGSLNTGALTKNVYEYRKVIGCPTPVTQVTQVGGWTIQCGETITITLRLFSSYISTLYFNGLTRSVTLQAPCCDCTSDPCTNVDVPTMIDQAILKLSQGGPGTNPDNLILTNFLSFRRIGTGATSILEISEKPLTSYGQPCDVAAFPHEYDRMWFNTFVYPGPATTADFLVRDNCDSAATVTIIQRSSFASGTSKEIEQLEKNYYSYQASYLKHLFRSVGYNGNFESWVTSGTTYDTFYIKYTYYDGASNNTWGDYVALDSQSIIACPTSLTSGIETILAAALGAVTADNTCITSTSTTTTNYATTTTTTTLLP